MTEMTRISTITPRVTPRTEMTVMTDTKVRFGLRYRSAMKSSKGSFISIALFGRGQRAGPLRL